MTPTTSQFDLPAYLQRIGYSGPIEPTARVLRDIHRSHATSVPFENVDVLCGQPIPLHAGALANKLVAGKRGGCCYEQNTLLALALRAVGFDVTPLLGSSRRSPGSEGTHLFNMVHADGKAWIADVGYWGDGTAEPVPLDGGTTIGMPFVYQVRTDEGGFALHAKRSADGSERHLYTFTLQRASAEEVDIASSRSCAHSESGDRQTLLASIFRFDVRHRVMGNEYVVTTPQGEHRQLLDDKAITPLLRDVFGLAPRHWSIGRVS